MADCKTSRIPNIKAARLNPASKMLPVISENEAEMKNPPVAAHA